MSTHALALDRLGLMMQFGNNNEHHVAVRYFHYSNAGFKKPNPGLDFIALSYQREF
ncbi:acyloxyacyl hydrolase [Alteromonas alba]|uniref:acyloxyacyl hydrolase n=1 Tax=Alteromonas alba TaxID=2079529 RepID=UPI001F0C8801|nr:acyloxyacyl hydrolase [Alteromonas alba]